MDKAKLENKLARMTVNLAWEMYCHSRDPMLRDAFAEMLLDGWDNDALIEGCFGDKPTRFAPSRTALIYNMLVKDKKYNNQVTGELWSHCYDECIHDLHRLLVQPNNPDGTPKIKNISKEGKSKYTAQGYLKRMFHRAIVRVLKNKQGDSYQQAGERKTVRQIGEQELVPTEPLAWNAKKRHWSEYKQAKFVDMSWQDFVFAACGSETEVALFGIALYEGLLHAREMGQHYFRLDQCIKAYSLKTQIDFSQLLNNQPAKDESDEALDKLFKVSPVHREKHYDKKDAQYDIRT